MSNQNAPYGRVDDMSTTTPMSSNTKKEIVKVSGILGAAMLLFIGLSRWSSYLLQYLVNSGTIDYTFTVEQIAQILYTFLTILVPFAIAAYFIKKVQKRDTLLLLDKPRSGILFIEALGIGLLAIMVANLITGSFISFFETRGVTFDSYKPDSPTNTYQLLWMLLSNAIVPALVEEFALRGVILQSLRKYGDAFAVFASAILFAIMHGNMTQAPFAFLLGAVFAMLVIMTGSLWTAMAIHAINNTYSVVMNMIYDMGDDRFTTMLMVALYTLAAIYGVIALIYFFGLHGGREGFRARYQPGGPAKRGIRIYRQQAWLYTIVSPTMLVALVLLFADLFSTVHLAG